MSEKTPEQLIAEYLDIWVKANGANPPSVTYKCGWFRFRYGGGPSSKFRKAHLHDMMRVLRGRIAEASKKEAP